MELYLVDAADLAKRHPLTFEVPSAQEIAAVEVGDYIKVCFNDLERMWLQVTLRDDVQGVFYAALRNQPVVVGAKYGDVYTVEPKNIYQIMKSAEAVTL